MSFIWKTENISDTERFSKEISELEGTSASFSDSIKENLKDLRETNSEIYKKAQEVEEIIKVLQSQKEYLDNLYHYNNNLIVKIQKAVSTEDN